MFRLKKTDYKTLHPPSIMLFPLSFFFLIQMISFPPFPFFFIKSLLSHWKLYHCNNSNYHLYVIWQFTRHFHIHYLYFPYSFFPLFPLASLFKTQTELCKISKEAISLLLTANTLTYNRVVYSNLDYIQYT